jgi:hypothetical protein
MLRDVGSGKFGHVMCVLTSRSIEVESYWGFQVREKFQTAKDRCA